MKQERGLMMTDHKILLTGDFWHREFQGIVSSFDVPVTLVPIEKVESVSDSKFDLIIVAQSRRNQFFVEDVEKLQSIYSNTPVIALLGSWCEGETRSGEPIPGLIRIFWHQWTGRYARFVDQLATDGITSWHAPRTSTVGDLVSKNTASAARLEEIELIGVSAWTRDQYEMLADAVEQFGWKQKWIERGRWDRDSVQVISAVCVVSDSWSGDLQHRIKWIRSQVPDTPIVLLLNYPREREFLEIRLAGVAEVVSKPFELEDLRSAIVRCTSDQVASGA